MFGLQKFGRIVHRNEIRTLFSACQVNEEASDKVLEVEQRYNEIRRPVYNRRNDIISGISDFWLTAVRLRSISRSGEFQLLRKQ